MQIWSAEIKQLWELYESLKDRLPEIRKELEQLIKSDDANVILLYSRRCLEVIITDLCECELKRPRKTEPLKGIIDKLNKEEKVPPNIITSMHGLNDLSTYGTHPKDFDPEQVKPVLSNLSIIIKWYLKYKGLQVPDKTEYEKEYIASEQPNIPDRVLYKTKKRPVILFSGISLVIITFVILSLLNVVDFKIGNAENINVEKSIAVLPFKNGSSDTTNTYFIDGLMEEVLNNLQRIGDLRVISRTSVEQYRNLNKTIPQIASELGVNYIVEGSGQKFGNVFRLRVQLLRAAKEDHLWGDSYQKEILEVKDIFNIQSQIAEAIAEELKAVITPQEKQIIEKTPTDNAEAYRLYTVGNYFMSRWGEDNFRKAIDNYKQALALDSGFAQAYANLASAYFELTMWDVPIPYPEFIPLAMNSALKALDLNKNLGEAYFVIGSIKFIHELDFDGAEQAFKKGMELSPNYVWGRINYANFLTAMGRYKESIAISQWSLKLNPLDPGTYVELGYAMFRNSQDREAVELFNKSLELSPDNFNTIGCLIEFYSNKGNFNQFLSDQIDSLMGSPRIDIRKIPTSYLTSAGLIFARVDHRDEVLSILDELNRRAKGGEQIPHIDIGFLYNALGEYEKAIDYFETGFNNKESWIWIKDQCTNSSIRSNRRFKELMKKMGFDEN